MLVAIPVDRELSAALLLSGLEAHWCSSLWGLRGQAEAALTGAPVVDIGVLLARLRGGGQVRPLSVPLPGTLGIALPAPAGPVRILRPRWRLRCTARAIRRARPGHPHGAWSQP